MNNRVLLLGVGTTIRTNRCFFPHRFFTCRTIHMETHKVEVVVADPHLLDAKVAAIRNAGPPKLKVIADFDATLTKYRVNGCRGQSSHGLLQQENPEYDKKRRQLYEYYHPLEFSPTIPIQQKTLLMEEWWGKTHSLLVEVGVTYDGIKQSVADSAIAFREGVVELFEFLECLQTSSYFLPLSLCSLFLYRKETFLFLYFLQDLRVSLRRS
ncbi:hypothetical protein ACLB2K_068623 [Fragaria x ananassa]